MYIDVIVEAMYTQLHQPRQVLVVQVVHIKVCACVIVVDRISRLENKRVLRNWMRVTR